VGTVKSRIRAAVLKLGESWNRASRGEHGPAVTARGLTS